MTFFYNLNKTLDAIREKPELKHGQLNERAMPKQRTQEVDEGFVDTVKSGAQAALQAIGSTLGHGSDEDMIKDLQKKAGVPVTGKVPPQQPGQQTTMAGAKPTSGQLPMAEEGGIPMTPKQKKFAAIAEPKDKITFADKIAGAKKEVDEMLGDVAAEAMKNALRGKQQVADEGNAFTGALAKTPKGGKFKVGGKEFTDNSDIDEGWDDMLKYAKDTREKTKKGEITHGAKHDIEDTGTGRRVTRRTDPNTGYSVGADDDKPADGEKRGRGRPKKTDKAPERVTAKAYKHKGGRKEKVKEESSEGSDLVKLSKVIASCTTRDQLLAAQKMANNFLKKHMQGGISNIGSNMRRRSDIDDTLQQKNRELQGGVEEEAVSKAQRKAAGIAHAAQKGEIPKSKLKGASKEMAKMPKGELKKFASTKEKGLPNKKEKTEETTTAGSVAPAAGGKAKKGGIVGKGIYDSINRELEDMIAESMNVSVNMSMDENGEPRKNITVSAEGEAAEQLAQLLNLAGMAAQEEDHGCGCETSPCSCGSEEELDENQPDWPTDQVTTDENDPEMRLYSGGLNGPKSTGQTVGAPFNRQDQRQGVMAEGTDLGMKLYAELKSFKG